MLTETTSTYLEERILSATPLELIEILYDAAIDRVRAARLQLSKSDAMARSHDVSKALEILAELTLALKSEDAKDSAATYSAIYIYLQKRLVEAHSQQSDSMFAEVEEMLGSLAENWRGIKDLVHESRVAMDRSTQEHLAAAPPADTAYNADAIVEPANSDPARPARCWNL
jgi:flagellar protein FliS